MAEISYNWFVWAVHCKKNDRNTSKDMIKFFFFMTTLGLMSLVITKYLETFKWDFLPHPPYSPDIVTSDYWLFRRMQQVTGSLLSQKSKIGSKIGSPPKTRHFFEMEFENSLRWKKSSRQLWTILQLIYSFILFWNKCTKKRIELICIPNIFSFFLASMMSSSSLIDININFGKC